MKRGFTLAELLIALAILGVIATFTIPKVLQSQQDTKYKSYGKELAATVSEAYIVFKSQKTPTSTTKFADLTPYLNYVEVSTSASIDDIPGGIGPTNCDSTWPCLRLHNGAC